MTYSILEFFKLFKIISVVLYGAKIEVLILPLAIHPPILVYLTLAAYYNARLCVNADFIKIFSQPEADVVNRSEII